MISKVIFLDIDGVFTSERIGWYNFDIYAVHWLKWCLKQRPDWGIVISSTWRHQFGKEHFEMIFGKVLHQDWKTPDHRNITIARGMRGAEIKTWLERHIEIEKYIIIDDDSDFNEEQMEHCIFTDPLDGMLSQHKYDLRNRLKLKGFPSESNIPEICPEMFSDFYEKIAKQQKRF